VVIELVHLTKRYGDFTAVDDVSISVRQGETLVLVGGSGSGKTTTLKMVNRLVEPSAGRVLLDGDDVLAVPAPLLRRRIGYVFQKVGLFPHMTVAENVAITLRLLGWEAGRMRRRVDDLLRAVELDPGQMADRRPTELSGGEQQRVVVARALAAEPKVMLLDEPFGALDPITRDRLQKSFLRLRAETGLTAIFVTHDLVEALLLADRIGVMRRGELVQLSTPRELLARPANEYVAELVATPRAQAELVERLVEREPRS
jgi:osmoprotectant transport system ATP-binding protein